MRTAKELYSSERIIYQPELSACPQCGGALVMYNYLSWDKTVQTLDRVLSVASRPGHCADLTCSGLQMHLLSAQGQQIAPPGSTYGYDVLVRIGWLRQDQQATYQEIQAELSSRIQISESHVRHLYQSVYLPLLACHERQHWDHLTQTAQHHGGLIIALDGLAPEGGEPQLWFMRELLTGLTLRSGWLSQQDHTAFESFLRPLRQLEWPILAVLSDKQKGLVPAVTTILPDSPHQFCQAHYLNNLAEPLAEADSTFNVALRQAVRQAVGPLIRAEPPTDPSQSGVLTVTGLLPSRLAVALDPEPPLPVVAELEPPPAESSEDHTLSSPPSTMATPPPAAAATQPDIGVVDEVVTQLLRRTRYLLTLKGRPPFRLAGLETYQRLQELLTLITELLAHRYDARLAGLSQGLQKALSQFTEDYQDLQQGVKWLREIAALLESPLEQPTPGEQVAQLLRRYLDDLLQRPDLSPRLDSFRQHLDTVSTSYWPGLFHCYDLAELPRTNNGLESRFRDTQRRLLRTTGQRGQTRRTLQRTGAWELLPRPATEAERLAALRRVQPVDLAQEQQRLQQHRKRFRLHTRSTRLAGAQLESLRQQWLTLPSTG